MLTQMLSITTQLLETYIAIPFGARLLTLGVEPQLAADWAVQAATGQVWAVADYLPTIQATERLAGQQRLSALHPLLSADLAGLPAEPFDLCVVDMESYANRLYLLTLLWQAAARLKPGGSIFIVGANDGGVRSLEKRLREAWGVVSVLAYKKGHRILQTQPPSGLPALEIEGPAEETVELRGASFVLALHPGVFAGGALDPAAALLAEVAEFHRSGAVLDLGCGNGILGMLAARLGPKSEVTLLDASASALATASENCQRNHLPNTRVLPSDGVSAVRDQRFDLVLCNPPFHQQRSHSSATALRFIREVGEVLAPRGRFYLVANQFLRYEPTMQETFGNVATVIDDGKYKVLLSERTAG